MRKLVGFLLLTLAVPAYPTISRVQMVTCTYPGSTTDCTMTVSATTAGNLGVITFTGGANVSLASVSGGGTWTAHACSSNDGSAHPSDMAYILSLNGGVTSITATANNNYADFATFTEYAGGTWSIDVACSTRTQTATTAPLSPRVVTTGANDLIVTVLGGQGAKYGSNATTGTGWNNPYTIFLPTNFANTQAVGNEALNVAAGTYQCTFPDVSTSDKWPGAAIAFTATAGISANQQSSMFQVFP